jgi:hypothetical protein
MEFSCVLFLSQDVVYRKAPKSSIAHKSAGQIRFQRQCVLCVCVCARWVIIVITRAATPEALCDTTAGQQTLEAELALHNLYSQLSHSSSSTTRIKFALGKYFALFQRGRRRL